MIRSLFRDAIRYRRTLLLFCACAFILILSLHFPLQLTKSATKNLILSKTYKVVVFNRVPKTGSTSIVRIFETLSKRNDFRVYRIAIFNPRQFLNPLSHKTLVEEVKEISQCSKLLVHGHFFYINLRRFSSTIDHVYINCLRNPLERLISKYYFVRFGDDHRPNTQRRGMTNDSLQMQTFEECVEVGGKDCAPKLLWVQIPFFCGNAAYCNIPGNPEALQTAKRRLVEEYLLVGVLEYFNEFMELLAYLIPDYLAGIEQTKDVKIGDQPLWHLRKTRSKAPVQQKVREFFQNDTIWRMEDDFYEFAKSEFLSRYQRYKYPPFDRANWGKSVFIRAK
ncbi:Heparin sulfate O-sulfotransferase [Echinococcus granulosus]|uniref:Heparan sulfate 2 O sulfotransferase HS2ST1 n=1 Tax=Echinococcus granulosus TaxID=6210 RepID=U6J6S9_ECHGR|nr:Heparin sulfate O-sulfotransferase [Echinococcus granulosus]EUB58595.1 Heparin sulfate O-sulfotransferase [Echinococcus granulosus]KAH9280448.1 Heparin sulfate O-sulfotransferase [Echinococcus granulosus]CDS19728.1 heparan sulfate 2 O sulfotransferase HS2ST1 [Echinococcus granulosus]